MRIITDTREQLPYRFQKYPVVIETAALPAGDYSLSGFEDRVAIERKALNDLIGCMVGDNRARFERELSRGRHYEIFAVVVEADLQDISNGRYTSKIKPHSVLQSITAFFIRYGIPFLFCGDRAGGEYVTYSILEKYLYEIEKRFNQAQKATAL